MNRAKLLGLALLVLVAGAVNLYLVTQWLSHDAVAGADAVLQGAAALLDARSQLLGAQAAGLAEAAARAPAVLEALAEEGNGDPGAAAAVAVAAAARGMPADATRSLLVGTAGIEGVRLRLAGKAVELQDPPGGLFADPLRGSRREGYVLAGDAFWFMVAVPAGKGAVAVGLPVDASWVTALQAASGADVTLVAGQQRTVSTLGAELATVRAAAQTPQQRPVDVGSLPAVRTALPWLPPVPLFLAPVPAQRVQVLALRGMKTGRAAISVPMAQRVAPLATYQVVSAAVLLLLLLCGALLALLISSDVGALVPRELIAAADRIQRGDFAARVPRLAGSMGTVAAALNRAADAAQEGAARPAAPSPKAETAAALAAFAPEPDPFEPRPPPAAGDPLGDLFAPPRATPAPTPGPPAPGPVPADLFAPGPPAAPSPQPSGLAPLGNTVSGATSLSTRPEDLVPATSTPAPRQPPLPPLQSPPPFPGPPPLAGPAAAAPPSPAAAADPDEGHWQEVHQEFLRVRARCGEPVEGLPYDRFQAKLRSNRAALVEKHACRTVRFQVYVKEGKAALKATPIR